jgi:hypothetical protein
LRLLFLFLYHKFSTPASRKRFITKNFAQMFHVEHFFGMITPYFLSFYSGGSRHRAAVVAVCIERGQWFYSSGTTLSRYLWD